LFIHTRDIAMNYVRKRQVVMGSSGCLEQFTSDAVCTSEQKLG